MSRLTLGITILWIAIGGTQCAFCDDLPENATAEDISRDLEQVQDAFRSVVIEKALADKSPSSSLSIARKRGYVDERFNELIDRARREFERHEPSENIVQCAVRAVSLVTLDDEEKVDFLLTVKRKFSTNRGVLQLVEFELKGLQSTLASTLKDRLSATSDVDIHDVQSLRYLRGNTGQFVPLLIEIARTDDRTLSETAISYADGYLSEYAEEMQQRIQLLESADRETQPAANIGPINEMFLKYAERIISRYDKNVDGMLTPSEWSQMLMSPAKADADADGRISVREYAYWIQTRNQR